MLTQVPKGMKRSDYLMQMEATLKQYTSEIHLTEEDIYDADRQQPPRYRRCHETNHRGSIDFNTSVFRASGDKCM